MNLRKISDEVFVASDPIVKIGPAEVAFVKQQALLNQRKRARICAHKTNDDALHEMIIAIAAASYVRPHKHLHKAESFHIVEGEVDVVVFDDVGGVVEVIELGGPLTGRNFFYRLAQSSFHTLLIRSEFLVVHEVTNGPFLREATLFAAFAPQEENTAEARDYMKRVAIMAQEFRQASHTIV